MGNHQLKKMVNFSEDVKSNNKPHKRNKKHNKSVTLPKHLNNNKEQHTSVKSKDKMLSQCLN